MVRAITLACAFIALFALVYAADEDFKCYKCTDCNKKDAPDATKVDCSEKKCYTKTGTDDKVSKGCFSESVCPTNESCDTCEDSECNSAASISSSLFIGVVGAMLLKFYY